MIAMGPEWQYELAFIHKTGTVIVISSVVVFCGVVLKCSLRICYSAQGDSVQFVRLLKSEVQNPLLPLTSCLVKTATSSCFCLKGHVAFGFGALDHKKHLSWNGYVWKVEWFKQTYLEKCGFCLILRQNTVCHFAEANIWLHKRVDWMLFWLYFQTHNFVVWITPD